MKGDANLYFALLAAVGMIVVAALAVVYWRRVSGLGWKWLWAGAGLWAAAVLVKFLFAAVANRYVFGYLTGQVSFLAFVLIGGLYVGLESSLCEIGFTWLAVRRWPQLGQDADRAIGVGVGAGAFEAFLLGLAALIAVLAALAHGSNNAALRAMIDQGAATTPLFWLAGPVERIIAILCHASSRALVLLGVVHRQPNMVFSGFLIFTLLDGVAGAAFLSGKMGTISLWWIELMFLPFGLVSIPILKWCRDRWAPWKAPSHRHEFP
jgi:YhfC intramembrane metalloprotease